MKLEFLGSASAGFFAVVGSWLSTYGLAWEIMILSLLGAMAAVLDLEDWTARRVGLLLLFNTTVGAFGGPVLLAYARLSLESVPPAAFLLVPFLMAFAAHSIITELRDPLLAAAARALSWVAGAKK